MKKSYIFGLVLIIIIIVVWCVYSKPSTTTISTFTPTASDLSGLSTETGTCWTNSIAAPYREDAWRCMVGNSITDPCFAVGDATNTLMCEPSGASSSAFALSLTSPLPQADQLPSPVPSDWAWKIALSDGTTCAPFTGTRPYTADHQVALYGCDGGAKNESYIFAINSSSTPWMATVGTMDETSTTSLPTAGNIHQATISTVWQ